MSYEEIESVEIVYDKKNYKLLHNRALMKYLTDTITIESLKEFRTHLSALDTLKKKDRVINTSLAIIDYYLYTRSEEHTSELQSRPHLVCRLLLEKKKK